MDYSSNGFRREQGGRSTAKVDRVDFFRLFFVGSPCQVLLEKRRVTLERILPALYRIKVAVEALTAAERDM
jgi:hypothetical protein